MTREVDEAAHAAAGVPDGRVVTVLRRPDCSHGALAVTAIKSLAVALRIRVRVDDVLVKTDEEAGARGCLGSPTVLVDGRDVDPGARGRTAFGVT